MNETVYINKHFIKRDWIKFVCHKGSTIEISFLYDEEYVLRLNTSSPKTAECLAKAIMVGNELVVTEG